MPSTTTLKKVIAIFISTLFFASRSFSQNVGINTTTPEAALDINGDIVIRTCPVTVADGITPALDVNTARFSYYRITGPTADFTLAGITAGIDGRLVTLFNQSGFTMQINNEDNVNAVVTEQIVTGTNADITIINKGIVNLQYDATEQKWIVKSSSKGSIAGGAGYWDTDGSNIYNNNTGNVGIGVNIPLASLHIKKDLEALRIEGTAPYISFYNEAGALPKTFIQNTDDNLYLGTSTGNPGGIMQFYMNSSPTMTLLPTGYVGIGTDAPTDKLTVQTPGANYGVTHTDGIVTVGTWIGTDNFFPGGWIGTKSNHPLNFFTGGSASRMIVLTNGNVGIATINPGGTLVVGRGTAPQGTAVFLGTSHHSHFNYDVSEDTYIRAGKTGSAVRINDTHNGPVIMAMGGGNVGIGTNNPTYKLSVRGNIRSTEVVVETGWADYVFDKNYKLLSLDEIEKFIQQNKHLPNIPSAKEVEEKGLYLGDTQKRMMEKIEELMLYVIALNKEIEALKRNNQ